MDSATLFALIAAWATVLMLIIALAKYLEELEPSINNDIAFMLTSFTDMKLSDLLERSNRIFLSIFDLLYTNNNRRTNFFIWQWIVICIIFTVITGLLFQFFRITFDLENLLIYSVIYPTFAFLMVLYILLFLSKKNLGILQYFHMIILIFLSIIFGLLYSSFLSPLLFPPGTDISFKGTVLAINILFLLIFYSRIFDFIGSKYDFLFKISPIRAIISTVIFLLFIAWIKIDIAKTFISDFNRIGMKLLTFVFLNIFADSISLWETSIILRIAAAKASIQRFFGLMLVDLFLSVIIFFAIPLSTGNLHIFNESIFFKGDHPWLGILFYATFFTSAVFWFYLSSIGILVLMQRILRKLNEIDIILSIEDKPIHSLSIVAMVLVTLIFFILSIIL